MRVFQFSCFYIIFSYGIKEGNFTNNSISTVHRSEVNKGRAEVELLKFLFTNYTKDARPVLRDNETVLVQFGLTLNQVIDVHEKNQLLTTSVWIRQSWNNPLLSWDPQEFNNITEINVNPKKVWLPDIVLYNNADEDKSFGGNLDRLNTRVRIKSNGKNIWQSPVILKSKCTIDVEFFPFDTQKCILKFGSWTYDGYRLNLTKESDTAELGKYSNNSEWFLAAAPCIRNEIVYYCCPEPYPDVTFTLVLKRRSLFYLINLIFPMIVIGMLTMLSFLLPAESGERISLAITLLLAMTVFMLVVADIIPPTSEVIPLVAAFFSAAMVEMVLMIIILCYVMKVYHKSPNDPPMPLWMRRFILDWLSYKLGIRKTKRVVRRRKPLTMSLFSNDEKNSETQFIECNPFTRPILHYNNDRNEREKNGSSLLPPRAIELESMHVSQKIDILLEKLHNDEQDLHIRNEWRICALTIDKFLLICFFMALVVTILACFLSAPGYVP